MEGTAHDEMTTKTMTEVESTRLPQAQGADTTEREEDTTGPTNGATSLDTTTTSTMSAQEQVRGAAQVPLALDGFSAVEIVQHFMEANKNPDHALVLVLGPRDEEDGTEEHKEEEGGRGLDLGDTAHDSVGGAPTRGGGGEARVGFRGSLAGAVNTARIATDIWRKMIAAGGWSERFGEPGERFLDMFLKKEVLQECAVLKDEWVQEMDIQRLLEQEPFSGVTFKEHFHLGFHAPSKEGILEIVNQMWRKAIHIGMVAGILTYNAETICILRVRLTPAHYLYLVADTLPRPGLGREQPTIAIAMSKEIVADYVSDLWADVVAPKVGAEGLVSAHMLTHGGFKAFLPSNDSMETLVGDMGPNDLGEKAAPAAPRVEDPQVPASEEQVPENEEAPQVPPNPLDETPGKAAVETNLSTKLATEVSKPAAGRTLNSKSESAGAKASKQRLQSEFGWQLGLQNQSLILPMSKNDTKPAPPDAGDAPPEQGAPSESPEVANSPSSNDGNNTETSSRSKAARSELYKKDFGWQLALQEEVGGITLPSSPPTSPTTLQHRKGASAASLSSSSQRNNATGSSSSLHRSTKSASTSRAGNTSNSRLNGEASSSQAEIERQKPVRNDIGWQKSLQSKSMTFPLKQRTEAPKFAGSSTSVEGNGALPVPQSQSLSASSALGAPSPSHPFVATEFGALQSGGDPKASSTLLVPLSRDTAQGAAETAECEYCFGLVVITDLFKVGAEGVQIDCGHRLCKDCLRRHYLQEFQKRTYPILCPVCTLTGRLSPTTLDRDLMEKLEFSDVEFAFFDMLHFQTLPVQLSCPKCRHEWHHQRSERTLSSHLKCPSCNSDFCRRCHKDSKEARTEHVCKEKTIVKVLRAQQGRHCPGCQNLVKKKWDEDNHLVCHPTCGMHFCFRCGNLIADTAQGQDPERYAYLHYLGCVLKDDGADAKKCAIM